MNANNCSISFRKIISIDFQYDSLLCEPKCLCLKTVKMVMQLRFSYNKNSVLIDLVSNDPFQHYDQLLLCNN